MWTEQKWEEECGFYEEEYYLVNAIKRHLLSKDQRAYLVAKDISIEDILNGRTTQEHESFIDKAFSEWNAILGFRAFGFD